MILLIVQILRNSQDIDRLSLHMLLFADDIALFTTNQESIQLQLNSIYQYSCKWGLKINVNKTKKNFQGKHISSSTKL